MHFDYVKDWICQKFDEVCEDGQLPATRTGDEWGRATSVMAKALKARLLVYAASPLFNGSFPYKDWENTNFETPGYGKELISLKYDRKKWEVAKLPARKPLLLQKQPATNCSVWKMHSHYTSRPDSLSRLFLSKAQKRNADKDMYSYVRLSIDRCTATYV